MEVAAFAERLPPLGSQKLRTFRLPSTNPDEASAEIPHLNPEVSSTADKSKTSSFVAAVVLPYASQTWLLTRQLSSHFSTRSILPAEQELCS